MARPAEEARVRKARVDDQLAVAVIAADREAVAGVALERVAARDRNPHAVLALVGDRRRVAQLTERGLDLQRAVGVAPQALGAAVREPDVLRPGAGPDPELVLERAVRAAQLEVDPGPELAVDDAVVRGDVGAPARRVVAAEEVDTAGRAFGAGDGCAPVGIDEPQLECDTPAGPSLERQRDLPLSDVDRMTGAMRLEAPAALRERQRQLRELRAARRRRRRLRGGRASAAGGHGRDGKQDHDRRRETDHPGPPPGGWRAPAPTYGGSARFERGLPLRHADRANITWRVHRSRRQRQKACRCRPSDRRWRLA